MHWHIFRGVDAPPRAVNRGRSAVVPFAEMVPVWVAVSFLIACAAQPEGEKADRYLRSDKSPTYIGRQACVQCHEQEVELWQGSHHDLAMQVASDDTALGDFENAAFTHFGVTSTFFRRDGKFLVRTDGPGGELEEYEIAYTFGVDPLQQYLIELPGGRFQALSVAWDTRPAIAGGQRWFHLYPGEPVSHEDVLHWTGLAQNWNFMCAECHSTNLRKNYRPQERRYETRWSELDVSCEACHGPASVHVSWAEALASGADLDGVDRSRGLVVDLSSGDSGVWEFGANEATARRTQLGNSGDQIETCARCHSRRAIIHEDYVHGRPLMDTHRPALLSEDLYFADGQIKEEVYVYGSFLQSRMYQAGVTCSDCHDPHRLAIDAPADAVCGSCHRPEVFDAPSHHHHQPDSPGASCIECHMPARTYMVVDPRRDHSFRIPRPDLTVKIGVPNACTACHADQSARWAADTTARWYGQGKSQGSHYGEALHAGRERLPHSERELTEIVSDSSVPAIVRATALTLLPRVAGPGLVTRVQGALRDDDPLVRNAALRALEAVEPQGRLRLAYPLLRDSVRAVRIEAASILAAVPGSLMSAEQRTVRDVALSEYREVQRVNADRHEAHLNLGTLLIELGEYEDAEVEYREAMRINPSFIPTYINLADLYRLQKREADAERVLRQGLEAVPDAGDIHHVLGLALVRQKRLAEALQELERAVLLRPEEPQYSYVFGIALNGAGKSGRAIDILKVGHERHPADRNLLLALVTISRDSGAQEEAIRYAQKLVELSPGDPGLRQLLDQLQPRQ